MSITSSASAAADAAFSILHIADLHIVSRRAREYWAVYDQFITAAENSLKTTPTVVAICGDIFDNKTYTRPDEVMVFNDFVQSLLNVGACVIVIPGNHDMNMHNRDSIDLVTPIVSEYHNPNFHFYPRTGRDTVEYRGLRFTVHNYSPRDRETPPPPLPDTVSIALVHEPVIDMFGKPPRLSVGDLDRIYTVTLMGDIHRHQFCTPRVAYPGSMVQQNFGEDPLEHGYIHWRVALAGARGAFYALANPAGAYLNIQMAGDSVRNADAAERVTQVQRLRFTYADCTPDWLERTITMYETRFRVRAELRVDLTACLHDKKTPVESKIDVESFDTQFAESLAESHVDNREVIMGYHRELAAEKHSRRAYKWRPLYLEWNGMYGYRYGQRHSVNFEWVRRHSTFGITGNNKVGKSAIFDILAFVLWNDSDRCAVSGIVNAQSSQFECHCIVQSDDGHRYTITRSGGTGKRSASVKLMRDSENITRADIKATYAELATVVGTHDDFRTITHQASDSPMFINLSHERQQAYLRALLGFDDITSWKATARSELLRMRKELADMPARPELRPYGGDRRARVVVVSRELDELSHAESHVNPSHAQRLVEQLTKHLAGMPAASGTLDGHAAVVAGLSGTVRVPTADSLETVEQDLAGLMDVVASAGGAVRPLIVRTVEQVREGLRQHIRSRDEFDTLAEALRGEIAETGAQLSIDPPGVTRLQTELSVAQNQQRLLRLPTRTDLEVDTSQLGEYRDQVARYTRVVAGLDAALGAMGPAPPLPVADAKRELAELPVVVVEPPDQFVLDSWQSFRFREGCECCQYNRQELHIPEDVAAAVQARTIWDRRQVLAGYLAYWENAGNPVRDLLVRATDLRDRAEARRQVDAYNQLQSVITAKTDEISRAREAWQSELRERHTAAKRAMIDLEEQWTLSQNADYHSGSDRAVQKYIRIAHKNYILYQRSAAQIETHRTAAELRATRVAAELYARRVALQDELSAIDIKGLDSQEHWDAATGDLRRRIHVRELYSTALGSFADRYMESVRTSITGRMNQWLAAICTDTFSFGDDILLNGIRASSGSGFQKMTVSVLLRIAFMQLVQRPVWAATQIIDEGLFSSLDRYHLEQFVQFLPGLSRMGIHLILISHQEELLARLGAISVLTGTTQIGPVQRRQIRRDLLMHQVRKRLWQCAACDRTFADPDAHCVGRDHIAAMEGIELC